MTELMPIPEIERATKGDGPIDETELAAAAFLARYQGRTLDAYRYDLRAFFQWAADDGLEFQREAPFVPPVRGPSQANSRWACIWTSLWTAWRP